MCNVIKKQELEKAQTYIDALGAARAALAKIEALEGLSYAKDLNYLHQRAEAYRASVDENWSDE